MTLAPSAFLHLQLVLKLIFLLSDEILLSMSDTGVGGCVVVSATQIFICPFEIPDQDPPPPGP